MGAAASLTGPEEFDEAAINEITGGRFFPELYGKFKDSRGFVAKSVLLEELRGKTHVFLTHDWGTDESGRDNHERVSRINDWLNNHNVVTWFDSQRMKGQIVQQMFRGIDNALIVLVVITKNYIDKVDGKSPSGQGDNCLKEFSYADVQKTTASMLAIVHESRCRNTKTWTGSVGVLAGTLYCDNVDDDRFEANMQDLLGKIHGMIPEPLFNLSGGTAVVGPVTPPAVTGGAMAESAPVLIPKLRLTVEEEQLKCEQEMFEWIRGNAGVHPSRAMEYAQAFSAAGCSNMDRVARKMAKDGQFLAQREVDEDDAEDIVSAMILAGLMGGVAPSAAAAAAAEAAEIKARAEEEASAIVRQAERDAQAARDQAAAEAAAVTAKAAKDARALQEKAKREAKREATREEKPEAQGGAGGEPGGAGGGGMEAAKAATMRVKIQTGWDHRIRSGHAARTSGDTPQQHGG